MRAREFVTEGEGDPEGVPHVTKKLLQHIVQQVGKEGAHAIIKSLTWGDGALVTSGGRVLSVTALAPGLKEARARAYEAVGHLSWPGMQYRSDIAEKYI
jgi:phosphoribosylamine--glycine ligase